MPGPGAYEIKREFEGIPHLHKNRSMEKAKKDTMGTMGPQTDLIRILVKHICTH